MRRGPGPHRDPAVPPAGEPLREVVSSLNDGLDDRDPVEQPLGIPMPSGPGDLLRLSFLITVMSSSKAISPQLTSAVMLNNLLFLVVLFLSSFMSVFLAVALSLVRVVFRSCVRSVWHFRF